MSNWIYALIALMALTLLFTAGCTANRPYRTGFNSEDPATAVIETAAQYRLGFVEFDDQGWFWDSRQKQKVEDMIREEAGIGKQNAAPVIMVLFVHGWKNNAAYGNSNVVTFRAVLNQLADLEQTLSQTQNRAPRKMIGVYAGWRGLSVKSDYFPPLGKELSFWARKNAAQRVGGYGAMTELMMDLESLQKTNNSALPTNGPRTQLIIIGHSFGADAVYNSLSQVITERFVETVRQGHVLKPLGDQVILLNPAFEAARLYDLKQLALSVKDYSTNQRPVLSIFTSKGDWATGIFFPAGQSVATVIQSYRSGFQRTSNRKAVGWFKPFITHDLIYQPNPATNSSTLNIATKTHELRRRERLPGTVENIAQERRVWRSKPTTITFGDCLLRSNNNYRPYNPILVVSVDQKIMKDHSDIGNPVLINFLQEYIPFCDNDPAAVPDPPK